MQKSKDFNNCYGLREDYVPPPFTPDPDAKAVQVDANGYRDTRSQIESFILSGARLDAARAGEYQSDYHRLGEDTNPIRRYAEFDEVYAMADDLTAKRKKAEAALLNNPPGGGTAIAVSPPGGGQAATPLGL